MGQELEVDILDAIQMLPRGTVWSSIRHVGFVGITEKATDEAPKEKKSQRSRIGQHSQKIPCWRKLKHWTFCWCWATQPAHWGHCWRQRQHWSNGCGDEWGDCNRSCRWSDCRVQSCNPVFQVRLGCFSPFMLPLSGNRKHGPVVRGPFRTVLRTPWLMCHQEASYIGAVFPSKSNKYLVLKLHLFRDFIYRILAILNYFAIPM